MMRILNQPGFQNAVGDLLVEPEFHQPLDLRNRYVASNQATWFWPPDVL